MIVDGHEDLALNALSYGRDYLTSAHAIRAGETGTPAEEGMGRCMLGLTDWLRGRVGLVVATLQTVPRQYALPGEVTYRTPDEAHQQALAQLSVYVRWTELSEHLVIVRDSAQLDKVASSWADPQADPSERRVGFVLLMENAEPIRRLEDVGFWAEQGVRLIGPAWHANRFCGNTRDGGPLTALGRQLLAEMDALDLTLDISHMSEEACLQALDIYGGPLVASHAHSRRTVNTQRLLSDRVIKGIAAREGVVGVMPLNWALKPGWHPSDGKNIALDAVADAVKDICDVAGNCASVGIGSDFDGGQGAESTPAEIDTIADLAKLGPVLMRHGFSTEETTAILGGNWLRFLRRHLPGRAEI